MRDCVRASHRVVICVLSALLLLAVGARQLHAQAVSGNISGTVTDASGAVIVGRECPGEEYRHRRHTDHDSPTLRGVITSLI